ncbi:dATP/dGTP pyrophosphohydrolase domain-containing protein [Escherichia coli]|uniref:dATP/dGTP pyrophosphohydrolase domain-containing protein n=1 Tax=Escherichia coli TaxID=562 RepID=UPI003A98605E
MSDLAMKILKWQSTGDVGISSATLASIACGLKKNIYGHHFGAPHDAAEPDDLSEWADMQFLLWDAQRHLRSLPGQVG